MGYPSTSTLELKFCFLFFFLEEGGGVAISLNRLSFQHTYQPTNSGIVFGTVWEWYLVEHNSCLKEGEMSLQSYF